jgi:hypothetical protein
MRKEGWQFLLGFSQLFNIIGMIGGTINLPEFLKITIFVVIGFVLCEERECNIE